MGPLISVLQQKVYRRVDVNVYRKSVDPWSTAT